MIFKVFETSEQVGRVAAGLIAAQLTRKPDAVIGLATGSTPLHTYRHLVRLTNDGLINWSTATTFNLDEYIGLKGEHQQSFRTFMYKNLFSKVNLRPDAIHIPDGMAADPVREGINYDLSIQTAGGMDLLLLGIGRNGHIGFNEQADVFTLGTHVVNLTDDTIDVYFRYFDKITDVPKQALTMGIGTIMNARSIVLVVTGAGKSQAVRNLISGKIDPKSPGTILQVHSDVTVLLDREAASGLH